MIEENEQELTGDCIVNSNATGYEANGKKQPILAQVEASVNARLLTSLTISLLNERRAKRQRSNLLAAVYLGYLIEAIQLKWIARIVGCLCIAFGRCFGRR